MPVNFVPLDESLLALTHAFNDRMVEGKAPVDFYLPTETGGHPGPEVRIRQQCLIAVEGAFARGGFLETVYPGWLNDAEAPITNVSGILSEGVIDTNYLMLPAQMIKAFRKRNPRTFVVGMGGEGQPLPRVLKSAGWSVESVPFFFRMCRPGNVLRQLPVLQRPAWRKFAARTGAATGAGALAIRAAQALRGAARRSAPDARIELFAEWDSWADPIWDSARSSIRVSVTRTAAVLNELYAPGDSRLRRFRITIGGRPAAWVTAILSTYRNHRHFGSLTVAVILDALAMPGAHKTAICLASSALASEKADLAAANFSHSDWRRAFRAAGFWRGPSNYLLACSPALARFCEGAPVASGTAHFTRGDGDGRVNL